MLLAKHYLILPTNQAYPLSLFLEILVEEGICLVCSSIEEFGKRICQNEQYKGV